MRQTCGILSQIMYLHFFWLARISLHQWTNRNENMFFDHSETPLDTLDVTNSREIAIGEMAAMSENPMADVELSKHSVFEGAICGVFLTWCNLGPIWLAAQGWHMVPNEGVVTIDWKTRKFLASYLGHIWCNVDPKLGTSIKIQWTMDKLLLNQHILWPLIFETHVNSSSQNLLMTIPFDYFEGNFFGKMIPTETPKGLDICLWITIIANCLSICLRTGVCWNKFSYAC